MRTFTEIKVHLAYERMLGEMANVSGAIAGKDTPLSFKRRGKRELEKYTGKVFKVTKETFDKMKDGKIRGDRWSRYIDETSETGLGIKKFSLRNPSKPVVIEDEETGERIFFRRKQTDKRLRHNK